MLAWHTLESQLLIAVSHQQTKFYLVIDGNVQSNH